MIFCGDNEAAWIVATVVNLENIQTNIGLIVIPEKMAVRRIFLDLFTKLNRGHFVETLFVTKSNDFINSVLFLSGYTATSKSPISNTGCLLFRWEKQLVHFTDVGDRKIYDAGNKSLGLSVDDLELPSECSEDDRG